MSESIVMKFGGTSMGSAERIRIAASITAAERAKRPVAIVVSAMSKVTDLLLDTLRHAEGGDRATMDKNVAGLRERHEATARELLRESGVVIEGIGALVAEFERIAQGILLLGDRPPRSVDEAVAIGERLTALIIAAYLTEMGTPAEAVNAAKVVVTDPVFGNATPIMQLTRARAADVVAPLLAAGRVAVMTGFNGATADGKPTTLGRGGSDFSASILASALDASELWIWTDVDGIMTADPRLVKDARVLDEVTYAEAAELAYNGAKVLHPRTLAPLVEKKIPVWSKNSFNLDAPGTHIVPSLRDDVPRGARAVTSMANVALVSVEPASASISGTRVMARALDALDIVNAEVLTLSSSSYQQSFCFLVRKDELPPVLKGLEEALALEIEHGYVKPFEIDENVGLLAVVGEGMRGVPGLAGRVFTAVSKEGISIIAIAQGSSELTINLVVGRDGLERAVQAIHAECGLGRG
ncbi:MAG: aspartate kinase [Acidobacteria bacterium]|nr:aspartate kinase [Acidobacteriota bacterium]